MASMYYWFNNKGPSKGAYILDDGVVELDFSNFGDRDKVRDTPGDKIIGTALQNAKTKEWVGEFHGPQGFTIYLSKEPQPTLALFATYLRKHRAEAFQMEERLQADPVALLDRELQRHDWYYHYSDDNAAWASGNAHWSKIKKLMDDVPVEMVRALFAQHAPKDFTCPV